MGKKSLITSTSKKKPAAKAGTVKAFEAKKKMPKRNVVKSPGTKTNTSSKYKGALNAKKERKNMAASKENKKPTLKELVFKKFEHETQQNIYVPPKERIGSNNFIPPPYISSKTKAETERIKNLLFQSYRFKEVKTTTKDTQISAKKPSSLKKISRRELIFKKFKREVPHRLFKIEQPEIRPKEHLPPSFLADLEKDEAKRIQRILHQKYSLADLKTAAENAATETVVVEKAVRPEAKVTPKSLPSQLQKESDPVDRGIKILAAGIGFLFLLIIIASTSNSGKYYLKPDKSHLEIWKGDFSPLGESMMVAIPNVLEPEELKEIYTKEEIFPMVFAYYIDQADNLFESDNMPDLNDIKANLEEALDFSLTPEEENQALIRLNKIDQMILIYKADIAASRKTVESLEQAMDYLKEADKIEGDQMVATLIAEKQNEIDKTLRALEEGFSVEKETKETIKKEVPQPVVKDKPADATFGDETVKKSH
jgi:hypothetical protein